MTIRLRIAATAAVISLTLAGCGVSDLRTTEPRSELVIRWSQAEHRELTQNVTTHPALRTHLIDTSQGRDDLFDDLPASIPQAERSIVEGVDFGTHVIVLGVYGRCTETSHLELDDTVLTFVIERDDDVNCGWAPTQVEVWSVARADLPTPVVLHDQRGNPV